MTTTFETAKVGDRVWSCNYGWGIILCINKYKRLYPIQVSFETSTHTYTTDGKSFIDHISQSLFWDEVIITPPPKPLPKLEVDTKVFVWDNDYNMKQKRHFSHFEANKNICVFVHGGTSWSSTQTVEYHNWELAKD